MAHVLKYEEKAGRPWKPPRSWREVNLDRAESERYLHKLYDPKNRTAPDDPDGVNPKVGVRLFNGARLKRVALGDCPDCHGYKMIWKPKNERTGSERATPCPTCAA